MASVPDSSLPAVQFFESYVLVWNATAGTPATIGLTTPRVTNLDNLTKSARNKYTAVQTARLARKAATQAYTQAVTAMPSRPPITRRPLSRPRTPPTDCAPPPASP